MGQPQKLTEEERLDALAELLAQGAYRWILRQTQRRVDAAGTRDGVTSPPASASMS